jgi:hypothetical protein
MNRPSLSVATLLALAGAALAQSKHAHRAVLEPADGVARRGSDAASAGADRTFGAIPFSIAGIPSVDLLGSPNNTVVFLNFGAGSAVNGIGWNVDLEAFGASWRSELGVLITDSSGLGGFSLRPGTDDSPGGPTNYNSGGQILFLANYSIPDVVALGDGLIRLEFFESYDDAPGAADGRWVSGNLYFPTLIPHKCDGDANEDGQVAFNDVTSVLENWGATYPPPQDLPGPGDADHNRVVNFADVTAVLRNWGQSCP